MGMRGGKKTLQLIVLCSSSLTGKILKIDMIIGLIQSCYDKIYMMLVETVGFARRTCLQVNQGSLCYCFSCFHLIITTTTNK